MVDTILITGATGTIGRRLTPLLQRPDILIRAASRQATTGQVRFDWQDPATHGPAVSGVDALYLVPPTMIADPVPIIEPILAAARAAGVRRAVLISSMGIAFPAEPHDSGRRRLEALVRDSGLDWTILRPSGFMQNFSEGFLLPAVRSGVIPTPAEGGRVAMVDAGDIAAVAAAVLTGGATHAGRVFDVTGPAAISFAEAADVISRASGRQVAARSMTSTQFLAMLEGAGVPADYAAMLLRDQEAIRDGGAASVSDTVTRLTGRPARSFADYAADAAGTWH